MDKEFFIKNKKKIIIVVAAIAVSLIGFSLLNSTYSLFYHEETSKNTEGYSTGTLSNFLSRTLLIILLPLTYIL